MSINSLNDLLGLILQLDCARAVNAQYKRGAWSALLSVCDIIESFDPAGPF